MLNVHVQNKNLKKTTTTTTRFELWKSGNIWEDQLELKLNWLHKNKAAYIKIKKKA